MSVVTTAPKVKQQRSILQRYQVEGKLGVGLLATTYRAYDTIARKTVVLKVLKPEIYRVPAVRSTVRVRLTRLVKLRHPSVVPILKAGHQHGKIFWISPYMEGGNLTSRLESGAVNVRPIFDQITAGLAQAHEIGIVHGNLKPSNILFDRDGNAMVTDFALLDIADPDFYDRLDLQSATYLSPEGHLRFPNLDTRSDIYSVAVLMYEIISGQPPFVADDVDAVAQAHLYQPVPTIALKGEPRKTSQLRAELGIWSAPLERALAKQPEKRYGNLSAFARDVHKPDSPKRRAPPTIAFVLVGILCVLLLLPYANLAGASIADPLRRLLGNRTVAALQTGLFQLQDSADQTALALGLAEPEAPWEWRPVVEPAVEVVETEIPEIVVYTPEDVEQSEEDLDSAESPTIIQPTAAPIVEIEPVEELELEVPRLPDVEAMGTLAGEGIWTPYLTDRDGAPVAWRTYLQPDDARPLTVPAIIAFDLEQTELHYELGFEEPSTANGPRGIGMIAPTDRVPGKLLATFNGGFKATHGSFGAMSDDIVAIEPRAELATVAVYPDGSVQIGAWGRDIDLLVDPIAYRQNARLVVQNGEINDAVYSDSIRDWGGTINNEIVTWRSAIGLSADGRTLYYIVGDGLNMPVLAEMMVHIGVENGMLLDINAYWVHFAAITTENGSFVAEPLFAEEMDLHKDRYLRRSERDFFYVTLRE